MLANKFATVILQSRSYSKSNYIYLYWSQCFFFLKVTLETRKQRKGESRNSFFNLAKKEKKYVFFPKIVTNLPWTYKKPHCE